MKLCITFVTIDTVHHVPLLVCLHLVQEGIELLVAQVAVLIGVEL